MFTQHRTAAKESSKVRTEGSPPEAHKLVESNERKGKLEKELENTINSCRTNTQHKELEHWSPGLVWVLRYAQIFTDNLPHKF